MNYATSLKGDFDKTYKKPESATIVGIGIGILIVWNNFNHIWSSDLAFASMAIIHTSSAAWIYKIAEEQNRDKKFWGLIGFLFPVIALIAIGLSNKRRFQLVIDPRAPKRSLYKDLKRLGVKLISRKQYIEAFEVFEYIITSLSYTEEDEKVFFELQKITAA